MLNAKISGIIPALLTRSGRKVEPGLSLHLSAAIDAPAVLHRHAPLSLVEQHDHEYYPESEDAHSSQQTSRIWSLSSRPWPTTVGKFATIPPKIISEIPLPRPRSEINSPSQTRNIVPATIESSMAIVPMLSPKSTPGRTPDCLKQRELAPRLEERDRHRGVVRDLVNLLATHVAFL